MSKFITFVRWGIDALDSEKTTGGSADEFSAVWENLRLFSNILVPLSVFFGFVWEIWSILSTFVLTEGSVSFGMMLSVVTWTDIITSSIAMSPFVFLILFRRFILGGRARETEKKADPVSDLWFFVWFGFLIVFSAFVRFWNYGSVCVKDLPEWSLSWSVQNCSGYEMAFPGQEKTIVHWMKDREHYGNLGSVIIVPSGNVTVQIWTKSASSCWNWLRSSMEPIWIRFPPCSK